MTELGATETIAIQVFNNGTDDPITVSGYGFQPGAGAGLTVTGPPLPLVVPVGQVATLTIAFSPAAAQLVAGTVRVTSDDPDESAVDIAVTGIGFVKPLAPAAERAACLKDVERQAERYASVHLKQWADCFVAEQGGVACDAGARDLALAQAGAVLRAGVGGARDRACAGKGLTPTRLDLPATCGGSCAAIALGTMVDVADCLVCRQEVATDAMLVAAAGTVRPDLPATVLAAGPLGCSRGLFSGMRKAVKTMQRALGACELGAVTAMGPVDCATSVAPTLTGAAAKLDARFDACPDTNGMLGCRVGENADPPCLGTTAQAIANDLVAGVFGAE